MHSFRNTTSIFDDFVHYEKRQEEEDNRKVPTSKDGHDMIHREHHNRERGDNHRSGGRNHDRDNERDNHRPSGHRHSDHHVPHHKDRGENNRGRGGRGGRN